MVNIMRNVLSFFVVTCGDCFIGTASLRRLVDYSVRTYVQLFNEGGTADCRRGVLDRKKRKGYYLY
jgi:hypothetical protein